MKIFSSLIFAALTCFSAAQLPGADLTNASYSGADRNLTFSVSLGYNGPFLISGTNQRFKPAAAVSHEPGIYNGPAPWVVYKITAFEIFVDQSIAAYSPDRPGYAKVVSFASTNFSDGSAFDLKLKVTFWLKDTDDNSMTKEVEVKVPVKTYNNGAVFGIYAFEDHPNGDWHGVPTVASQLRGMNHSVTDRADSAWQQTHMETALGLCTVFYINTHGFTDPPYIEVQDPHPSINEFNPNDAMINRWNAWSSGMPPINFAFLDACSTASDGNGGESHAFSQALLFPVGNGTQGSTGLGRAQMGWLIQGWTNWCKPFNQAFWSAMAVGKTAHKARDAAIANISDIQPRPGESEVIAEEYVAVYGDYYTKLMTAYNGSDVECGWFYINGLEPGGLEG